jgi:NADH-quinone oxidoreductase subunit A
MEYAVLPIFLFVACVLALAVGLLVVANIFNPGKPGRVKQMPYESGMDPVHDTRRRFDVRFHLLAIAFLVFDVELLFLYPWAVASRPAAVAEGRGERGEGKAGNANCKLQIADCKLPDANPDSQLSNEYIINPQSLILRSSPLSPLPSPLSPPRGIDAAVAGGLVESRNLVFAGVMIFIGLLTLGFVYDWRKGVFRWR